MSERFSRFSPKAIAFLRGLKRHNDRVWFQARKEEYETLLRAPMIALVERLAGDLRTFAPELACDPKRSLYRIYRDTRFSEDKTPYKTHVAAHFSHRDLPKNECAGLYFEVAAGWVWIGGGLYSPGTPTLHAIREHIAANTKHLRAIVESPAFRRAVGRLDGEKLQRVPRGFDRDHDGAEYLKFRQFLAGCEYPVSLATSPKFYPTLVSTFRQVAPLVRFLNDALEAQAAKPTGFYDPLAR